MLLMPLLKSRQQPFYLAQTLPQGRLGIRSGKRGVGRSFLPPRLLACLALGVARLIGNCAADGFLDCGPKGIDFAGHEILILNPARQVQPRFSMP
jgi:hypothetical protein